MIQTCENNNHNSIENKWVTVTKLQWNTELQALVIKCMNEPDFIIHFAHSTNYPDYWSLLDNYMYKHYNCKPEKPDKFIFLLLLTYPKKYILNLKSFLQLKIAFNELLYHGSSGNSDFTCIGYYYSGDNNCICSQPIANIYEFQNNLSGTIFNVGSVCNGRHRVVSEDDENYKLMKRAERDRREEKRVGLPEGFKEQQRKRKLLTQEPKFNDNPINEYSSYKSNSYLTNSVCYLCNTVKIFSQNSNGVSGICSCVPTFSKFSKKKALKELTSKVTMINCFNCNKESRKLDNKNNLCLICRETNKVSNCITCFNNFTQIISDECQFCTICKPLVKKCLDCPTFIMYSETYRTRCNECFKRKKNTEITIDVNCKECNKSFEILEEQKDWRKTCFDCHSKHICDCENCNSSVKILIVKKEGLNKGKKFYKCDKCTLFKWL